MVKYGPDMFFTDFLSFICHERRKQTERESEKSARYVVTSKVLHGQGRMKCTVFTIKWINFGMP